MATPRKVSDPKQMQRHLWLLLSYDPQSGEFRWLKTKGRCRAGAVAGTVGKNGYRYIGFQGRTYLAHRLAWVFHFGVAPPKELDHANRNRLDNSIANLRPASRSQNAGNSGISRQSSTGYRGVSLDKRRGRWAAYIWRENRKRNLGYHSSPELAALAYNQAAKEHFGEFATFNEVEA